MRCGIRFFVFFAVGLVSVFWGPDRAMAFDFPGGALSLEGGVETDRVFRGRSLNDEDFSFNGRIDYQHDATGLFGGTSVNMVDLEGGEDVQLRFYGGQTGDIGLLFYVLSGEYTIYPDSGTNLAYAEFSGTVGIDYGFLLVRAGAAYSPDFFANSGDSIYGFSNFDLRLPLPLPVGVALNGEIGYQSIKNEIAFGTNDYVTWNLGVTFSYDRFDFDVRYHDTDTATANFGQEMDSRIVAGLKVFF